MTRTLQQIIDLGNAGEAATPAENAIVAAYWAGQSKMRGQITEAIKSALATIPNSRYHNLVTLVAKHVASVPNINPNHLYGHGDSGSGEAAEFLSWDFEV